MNSLIGTAKIILAFFVLLVAIIASVIPMIDHQFDVRNFLATVFGGFYAYYLAYSGRTQRNKKEIDKPIVIWLGIIYALVILGFFIYDGRMMWSSLLWGILVLIVAINDTRRMLKKTSNPTNEDV